MSRRSWLIVTLVFLTCAALGRLCFSEFTNWDDDKTVWLNPYLTSGGGGGGGGGGGIGYFWKHPYMDLYVPVTYTVWGALVPLATVQTPDVLGARLNPWAFHSANFLLHVLAVLVTFDLLRRLLLGRAADETGATWGAFAGAALFAIHPLQVEAVGWISGLKDVLSGLLVLVAVWQYLLWSEAGEAVPGGHAAVHPLKRRLCYAAATAAFAVAMFAKPTAVVAPVLAFILDVLVLGRRPGRAALALLPWLALALPVVVIGEMVQPARFVSGTPPWARPLIAGHALAHYLHKLVVPTRLALIEGHTPAYLLAHRAIYLAWAAPAAVAAAVWLWRPARRWLGAGGLLFVAGLLPVLGFVDFDFQGYSTVADHYVYVPMLGVGLAAAWLAARYRHRLAGAAVAAVIVALAVRSWHQAGYWRDCDRLLLHALDVAPGVAMLHNNYAMQLNARGQYERGNGNVEDAARIFQSAEAEMNSALRLDPAHVMFHKNLVLILLLEDRPEEAIGYLSRLLAPDARLTEDQKRHYAPLFALLGHLLLNHGRYQDAIAALGEALRHEPGDPNAREDLRRAQARLGATSATPSSQPSVTRIPEAPGDVPAN